MAEKIINNPSLLPGDLAFELSGNTITAISGHPIAGSGGGTVSDLVYYPVFDNSNGNVTFHLGNSAHGPEPGGAWHISGADGVDGISPKVQINPKTNEWEVSEDGGETWDSTGVEATGPQGIQGIRGIPGVDGKNPVFEINSSDAHWRWKYAEATSGWTDLGVVASGAVGPKGQDGTNGVTPGVRINTSTNKWEIAADGTTWVPTDVNATGPAGQNGTNGTNGKDGKDGKDGTNGKDGVSPTVSVDPTTGGTIVTFTYGTGQTESITVLNGTPGAEGASGFSPTVSTEAVTAEGHPQGGTKVTITDLEHQSGQEFYVWNGTNGQGATVNLLDGDGIHITNDGTNYTIGVSANYSAMAVTWVQDQHYLTDIPNTYALKTDVEAAYNEAVAQIPSVTDFITKDVNNLTYYYKKTETSSTSEITDALSTKLDSTVAEQTYQTKAGMTNYLTTSDASTTYQPIGNYASASDITDMATKTWVGGQGFLKNTDLTDYATKTYANEASANALSQAESWVETEGYIKSVPDISGNNGLSANGHTVGINNTGIDANKQYAWTTTGWQLVSVPTIPDITANNGLSATGHTVGISTTNIDANKQYAWTTTGWQLVSVPTIPDITANNGLSANGHTVGISNTGIDANKQYAWTITGWEEVVDYLPTSGGTVSGQLVVSGGGNFDQQFLKITRENVNGYGRIGLGSSGPLAFKVDDANSHTTQINISPNTTNDQLVQVQHNSNTVGYLIPAIIEQAGWTPSTDDKILHIVLKSE